MVSLSEGSQGIAKYCSIWIEITKCDKGDYKVQQVGRLQSPKELIKKYDGCWITKCKKMDYKMRQWLQSVMGLQSVMVQH